MATHTIGTLQRRQYHASSHSSTTAGALAVATRGKLVEVWIAPKINQTATAGSWTVSKNGTQITGLSSVALTTRAVGESSGTLSAAPSANTYVARGDILSVVGSSVVASNWTFVVQEF